MKITFLIVLVLGLTPIEFVKAADYSQQSISFDDAEAWNILVTNRIELPSDDRNINYSFPVFSHDYERLLYCTRDHGTNYVIIRSLVTWEILKKIVLPNQDIPIDFFLAFSPDEKIVALSPASPNSPMLFINLDTLKITSVDVNFPKNVAGGQTPMLWPDANYLLVFNERLNLDTLQITDTQNGIFGFTMLEVSKHKNCVIDLGNSIENTPYAATLVLNSRHYSYSKVIEKYLAPGNPKRRSNNHLVSGFALCCSKAQYCRSASDSPIGNAPQAHT